ncbi:thioredoxin [Corynebacterium falsenii DSM 44353]|uniref:thioredoxin n=1 Tax=Corynebacterium falsenii TaxID=108486 RepID=UPI0003E9479C|nr:thioredoxin [Corynebacterium falsenii]AHI04120.1 thioredoxin [Corynebacterium falsenii DSM 44353]MDC7103989.1 thioredoxin [Corynebacterium falsenii]UBI04918.1 thioredoxin [Corynebacterium falsenii]UBI07115.1 thioredoxin [Corynebacterium falsenii]
MATVQITGENFQETVQQDGIVVLDFWADWCGPCKRFAPIFEQISEEHPDATFGKVDTEANQDLSAALQIQSIPTIMMFRDGILLAREAGLLPPQALNDLINQAQALDMDEVRKQVAAQNAAADDAGEAK